MKTLILFFLLFGTGAQAQSKDVYLGFEPIPLQSKTSNRLDFSMPYPGMKYKKDCVFVSPRDERGAHLQAGSFDSRLLSQTLLVAEPGRFMKPKFLADGTIVYPIVLSLQTYLGFLTVYSAYAPYSIDRAIQSVAGNRKVRLLIYRGACPLTPQI